MSLVEAFRRFGRKDKSLAAFSRFGRSDMLSGRNRKLRAAFCMRDRGQSSTV
jgi:hypothetical protein